MQTQTIQNKLPQGWEWKTLKEIAKNSKHAIVDGPFGSQMKVKEFIQKGIPIIEMSNIKEDKFDLAFRRYISKTKLKELERSKVKEEDIIISKTGSLGYVAIIPKEIKEAMITSRLAKISLDKNLVNLFYVYYYLILLRYSGYWEKISKGSTMRILTIKDIANTLVPIPFPNDPKKSLELQHKIVQKLDAFFSYYNKLKEEKQRAKEKYEQILQSAIASLIPKKALLKGWKIDKLVNLCSQKPQYGYTAKSVKEEVGPIYLRITDIDFKGKIDWENVKYVDIPKEEYRNFKLEQGDIIIARTGATVGKSYLYTSDKDMVFASYLIRFRSNHEVLLPEYLIIYLQSSLYWHYISKEQSGTGQPNVNAKKLGDLEVIYPEKIRDQEDIIKKIKGFNDNIKIFSEEQKNIDIQLEQLPKAVLSKAFKGELV